MKALTFKLYESLKENPSVEELNFLLDCGMLDLREYSKLMGDFHRADGKALTYHLTETELIFIGKFDTKQHRIPFPAEERSVFTRNTLLRTAAYTMGYWYLYDPFQQFLIEVEDGKLWTVLPAEAAEKYGARPTKLRR